MEGGSLHGILSIDLGGSTLTVGTPGATTIIDATKIDVPNFRISANAISTLENGLTINASGKTVIDGNATMMQNLNVTGNTTIAGSGINLGDQPGDTIDFAQEFQNDLIPAEDREHNLGSASKNWRQANLNRAIFDGIEITNNVIRATDSNSSVDLRANGTGSVNLENLSFIFIEKIEWGKFETYHILNSLNCIENLKYYMLLLQLQ